MWSGTLLLVEHCCSTKARRVTARYILLPGMTLNESSLVTAVGIEGLPPATDIIPGNFGWFDTGFLFYDRTSGQGHIRL